jgi:hypothetical protein
MADNVIPEVKTPEELRTMTRTKLASYAETVGQTLESVLRVARGETWHRIALTTKEEERVIREYAQMKGYKTLHEYRTEHAGEKWAYYDILKLYYAGT